MRFFLMWGGRDFADLFPGNSLTRLTPVLQITHCPFWLVIPPHYDLGMGLFILTLGDRYCIQAMENRFLISTHDINSRMISALNVGFSIDMLD